MPASKRKDCLERPRGSGYATVCKTVYPGSIPGVASTLDKPESAMPSLP